MSKPTGWRRESIRHSLARKGIKTATNSGTEVKQPTWATKEVQDQFREEAYEDHIDNLVDEFNEDKTLPYLKENGIVMIRDEDGFIHVFDTNQKRVFEYQYHEEPTKYNKSVGIGRIGEHPSITTREYTNPGEYERRYKKYIGDRL